MIPIYAAAVISDGDEDGIEDPKCCKAATRSPLAEKWDTTMNEELDAIGQHHVIGDFVEIPEGRKSLPTHWVYKIRRDGAGSVQQFNTGLVCRGNQQIEAIDYQATYTPTAWMGHVRLELTISTMYDLQIHQMDVCTAFLRVDLEEVIYINPPQGYYCLLQNRSQYNDPRSKTSRKMVLRLRKSLYGIEQSSRVWYGTFKNFMVSIGFMVSRVAGALFMLNDNDESIVIAAVILYVDDLLIIANEGLFGQFKDQMEKRFGLHDLESVSFYLGMTIERNWEHHKIDIHQYSYIWTISATFRMDESRPVAMLMSMNLHKTKPDEQACGPTILKSMIGSHQYMMIARWPDISYAIGVLSWYNHDATNEHMVAVKRVIRYLNGTKDWPLHSREALGGTLWERALGDKRGGVLGC